MAPQAERLLDKFEDIERDVERDLRGAQPTACSLTCAKSPAAPRRTGVPLNAANARDPHSHYKDFAAYGDAPDYKRRLRTLRRSLKK